MAMTHKEIKQRYFDRVYAEAPLVECACGCGGQLKSKDRYGRDQQYINGHNGRKYEDPKEYKRAWRHRHRPEMYQHKKQFYQRRKAKLVQMLGGKCSRCDHTYNGRNSASFDFHHRDPSQKEMGFGAGWITNRSWDVVVAEVEKCDLVCRRCHQLIHHPVSSSQYSRR